MAFVEKQLKMLELDSGRCPFEEWYAAIRDKAIRARIRARLARMKGGNTDDCRPVGEGVSEARLNFGPGYRIYFVEYGEVIIVLLAGGDKKSQAADIAIVKKWWKEYKDEAERFQRDFSK